MRYLAISAAALMTLSAPALAATDMYGASHANRTHAEHTQMSRHAMTAPHRANNHGLGSIRHPSVGDTANQRINGG